MKNTQKGITLIALIITVIILLILAGVAISSISSFDLFGRVKQAVDVYNNAINEEDEIINNTIGAMRDFIIGGTDGGKYTPEPPKISEVVVSSSTGGAIANGMGVIEIVWLDMNNYIIPNPLPPKLASGMQPIKWSGTTEGNAGTNASPSSDWYEYKAQTLANDGKSSNWANVKLTDGSYFVWIPRYAYKIIYFDSEANANAYRANPSPGPNPTGLRGTSTIYGMVDTSGKVVTGTTPNIATVDRVKTKNYTDYIPHPAFLGTGYEDLGGGFGTTSKGISGFWVAKFEMSREDSANSGSTWSQTTTTGNVATKNAGSASYIRAVSKPNVPSWRSINIANCYENAYNYDRIKDSHLIKNSEWGAVAYLTHSKYGRNGTEIRINNNSGLYTGWGASSHDAGSVDYSASATDNLWTGQYGLLTTTTGNITGIYDLSGCGAEHVAGYNKAYSRTGQYFGGAGGNTDTTYRPADTAKSHFAYNLNGASDKYATAYNNNTTTLNATSLNEFHTGRYVSNAGDGIHEVWKSTTAGWFSDYSIFVNSANPFFYRGGYYNNGTSAGVFYASYYDGLAIGGVSFRVVCSM